MIAYANQPQRADLAEFPPEVLDGLNQLVQAVGFARDTDSPLWEFAVEVERSWRWA